MNPKNRFPPQQPAVAHGQQKQNAPYHVMDVPAMHRDIVERADVIVDGDGDAANHDNGNKEPERTQETATRAADSGKRSW